MMLVAWNVGSYISCVLYVTRRSEVMLNLFYDTVQVASQEAFRTRFFSAALFDKTSRVSAE